jgi:FkbM family methyltransferase
MIKHLAFEAGTGLLKCGLALLGRYNGTRVRSQLSEELAAIYHVDTRFGPVKLYCIGHMSVSRGKTFFTKEPETLRWIEGFEDETVFWDVGANIGVYSLYAALNPKIRVFSFEPTGVNFFFLLKNVEINKKSNVLPICAALSDSSRYDSLNLPHMKLGGSGHSFGRTTNQYGDEFTVVVRQAMISHTVDQLVLEYKMPRPNYIKIDVDGLEPEILRGARQTLQDKAVKSVLVELTSKEPGFRESVVTQMRELGLELSKKGPYNHIFERRT